MVDSQGTWRAFSGWTSLWAGGRGGDSERKRSRHASVTDIGEGEVIVRGEPGGGEGRRSEPHSRFLSSTSCNLVKGSLIDHAPHSSVESSLERDAGSSADEVDSEEEGRDVMGL